MCENVRSISVRIFLMDRLAYQLNHTLVNHLIKQRKCKQPTDLDYRERPQMTFLYHLPTNAYNLDCLHRAD